MRTNLGDPQIPHAHLHFHAMLGDVDTSLPGAGMWRRNVVFGSMNWWSIEDLRAEIRYASSFELMRLVQEGMADWCEVSRHRTIGSSRDMRIDRERPLRGFQTLDQSL